MAVCVWRLTFGGLRAVRGRFAAGFVCGFAFGSLRLAVCVWRLTLGGLRLAVCSWRFALGGLLLAVCAWRFTLGGSRLAVHAWRFTLGGSRLAVHAWRFTLGGSRLAVRVWRFAGGFAGGLRLAVCGRFASGKQAVVGRFAVGGLRLRLTKYTPRDMHNATAIPIKLRIAQRWTSSSSLLKTETMCVCMYGCMDVCQFPLAA